MLANVVCVLQTKALVWVEYPYEEYFVELFLRAAGLGVTSYHSELNSDDRNRCVNDFNTSNDVSVLVLIYRIGGVA
jgi:superfamily II DNA/RNA helicase